MKITPVSADLLIKLALGAAVIGAAVYAVRRASSAAGGLLTDAGQAVSAAVGIAVETADNTVSMPVYAIGDAVGLPRTEVNECQACIDDYRAAAWYEQIYKSFAVSAKCSAGDYARFITTSKGPLE